MNKLLKTVLPNFELKDEVLKIRAFGSGLINKTWRVTTAQGDYILQRLNTEVFKNPEAIEHNISIVSAHLKKYHPDYLFVSPVKTKDGREQVCVENLGYFRMFPFVKDSQTIDVVKTPEQAYEAAAQFGRFTKNLSGLDISTLKTTIPDFHNLSLRYEQYQLSTKNGNPERIKKAKTLIRKLQSKKAILKEYEDSIKNEYFDLRVTHHDTKISNVLFNKAGEGLCVIDLDTVMPGYFISDVGDMIRTYVSPVNEEEKDFRKIKFRQEFFYELANGYMSEMGENLNYIERECFLYAGKFAIYMQTLRFLTDYLNGDVYYEVKYEGHNLVRATNQYTLLQSIYTWLEQKRMEQRIAELQRLFPSDHLI